MDATNGSHLDSDSHQIIRNRKWLIIAPIETAQAVHIVIEKTTEKISFPFGDIAFKTPQQLDTVISTDPMLVMLDAKHIVYPLLLRKPQKSDYFYPLGLEKKKKISRFLSDQKLSKTAKEKVWVLESNKKIIWVIGLRIDNRFKITSNTKQLLSLHVTPI
jgi:tRNA(Ile)-lysidine synthase